MKPNTGTATPYRAPVRVSPIALLLVAFLALGGIATWWYSQVGRELTETELKYRLIDEFTRGENGSENELLYCDPDVWPVGRGSAGIRNNAIEYYGQIRNNTEAYKAITRRYSLDDSRELSEHAKLLVYNEYKKLSHAVELKPSAEGFTFSLAYKESWSGISGRRVEGLITRDGTITIMSRKPTSLNCPICLAFGTYIDTPEGPVSVEKLEIGMSVWTADRTGERRIGQVVKNGVGRVPAGHHMVQLELSDGRELLVSPGHPTTGTRAIGELRLGEAYDGATILKMERHPYDQPHTYDILPSGETGWYWANGILIGSSLTENQVKDN